MVSGFFGLMFTMCVGLVLAHGVIGIIGAGVAALVWWASAGPYLLKVAKGVNKRVTTESRADVLKLHAQ